MRRILAIVIVLAAITRAPSGHAQANSTTCDDFTYQQDVQKAWDRGEGRPRPDYLTGMDEDNDGKACEHLPDKPAIFETDWFRVAIGVVVVLALIGFWWSRKVKAAKADRATDHLFPGRTRSEEVEDELALLKADKAIDEAGNSDQNQG